MIPFVLYLLILTALIGRAGFGNLFSDEQVSGKKFAIFFFGKALAVPVFYHVYLKMYGGIELFDAGKFFKDASVIGEYGLKDPLAYLRLMFGLQNDNPGSADFVNFLSRTDNWDNGQLKDFLYNDNRVLIRFHSMIYFIAFGSYFVHALLNCFLGFIGIVSLYKAIKIYFRDKEVYVLVILCFFPSLWFYTGAVLKESIAMFIIGQLVYLLSKFSEIKKRPLKIAWVLFLIFNGCLLKPYLSLFVVFCLGLFFFIDKFKREGLKIPAFLSVFIVAALLANLAALVIKGRSLPSAIENHRRVFADAAKGGIFLLDSTKFVRLEYNPLLVKEVAGADSLFRIKAGEPYMYWELSHMQDTLYCRANTDSANIYKLVYRIAESKSNIAGTNYNNGIIYRAGASVYYSLFYPLFFNAKGVLQWLASFENLLIVFSLLVLVYGFVRKAPGFLPFVFLFVAISVCILVGNATPNTGAIIRYRSPVVFFIVLGALSCSKTVFKSKGREQNL